MQTASISGANDGDRSRGPLANRVALVTGAAHGLGAGLALGLARAGADLVVCDVDESALAETAENVRSSGARCLPLRCDVSVSAAVRRMFEQIADEFGTLHILVNNAGIVPKTAQETARRNKFYAHITTPVPRASLGFTSQLSDEEWHRYWAVNVHGVFYCTREALRLMEPQKYGRIINVASVSGYSWWAVHAPQYAATKGAVIAFTKSVAAEVAGANILVNALAPGGVSTQQFQDYLQGIGEEDRNRLWQLMPLGRFGTIPEYAATVVHLAGEHFMVGQVISPNGGSVI